MFRTTAILCYSDATETFLAEFSLQDKLGPLLILFALCTTEDHSEPLAMLDFFSCWNLEAFYWITYFPKGKNKNMNKITSEIYDSAVSETQVTCLHMKVNAYSFSSVNDSVMSESVYGTGIIHILLQPVITEESFCSSTPLLRLILCNK